MHKTHVKACFECQSQLVKRCDPVLLPVLTYKGLVQTRCVLYEHQKHTMILLAFRIDAGLKPYIYSNSIDLNTYIVQCVRVSCILICCCAILDSICVCLPRIEFICN